MSDDILQAAIAHYGEASRYSLLVGEIGELLTLYGRQVQGRDTPDEWIDELADVALMLRQVMLIVGVEAVEAQLAEDIQNLQQAMREER
jgi:hypothetical protein